MTDAMPETDREQRPRGNRRRWIGLVVIGVLLVGVSAWIWLGNRPAPRLVITPPSYDFGEVPADRISETRFTVTNAGNAPLIIESISTSCGCTQATISSDTIPPGESAQLDVTFDPRVHPGVTGPMFRLVYLATNDPTHPEAEIELRMNVVATDQANPE